MLASPGIPPMSWEHLCWICWPGLIFLQCPGNTYAGYAGQALYSSNVLGTHMLDMLARPGIPPMSWEHLCWICWPGLVFLKCPGNTYAGYAGQHIQHRCSQDIGGIQGLASISSTGVPRTLDEYKAWPAYPAYVFPGHWMNTRPGTTYAGYAGQALYSSIG